jgi:hypothetical protein
MSALDQLFLHRNARLGSGRDLKPIDLNVRISCLGGEICQSASGPKTALHEPHPSLCRALLENMPGPGDILNLEGVPIGIGSQGERQ